MARRCYIKLWMLPYPGERITRRLAGAAHRSFARTQAEPVVRPKFSETQQLFKPVAATVRRTYGVHTQDSTERNQQKPRTKESARVKHYSSGIHTTSNGCSEHPEAWTQTARTRRPAVAGSWLHGHGFAPQRALDSREALPAKHHHHHDERQQTLDFCVVPNRLMYNTRPGATNLSDEGKTSHEQEMP